jgi:hypothetical protein
MLRSKSLYLGIAVASSVLLDAANHLQAAVVYSENFEGMTVDTAIPVDPGNIGFGFVIANSDNTDENKLMVRGPSSPQVNGLTAANVGWSGSKFAQWHDNTIDGTTTSVLLGAQFPELTASPFSISFDYFEPSGYPATGGNPSGIGNIFAVVTSNSNSLNTTSTRAINLIYGDPTATPPTTEQFQTQPAATEGVLNDIAALDTKHKLQLFGNLGTGGSLSYKSGTESVADNTYDIWLDGLRIFNDVAYRNAITTWSRLGFAIGLSRAGTDVKYIDNILITNDLIGPTHPGDFDGDGDVDGADFVAWQTNFPTASGAILAQGDADGDGDVDGADFVVWQTNFPFTPGPGTTSIPEPVAMFLAVFGTIGITVFQVCRDRSRAQSC